MEPAISVLLTQSAARHKKRLCPRQVLGVRLGMAGAGSLGLVIPRHDKRLLVISESDGCFVDGVEAATGCSVGRRTLRIEDYGKVAATFVDIDSGSANRLAPQRNIRERAWFYAPGAKNRYAAQLHGYQHMPAEELFDFQTVTLKIPLVSIISRPGIRMNCDLCGEEIINERQVTNGDSILCRPCAGLGYYQRPEPYQISITNTAEWISHLRS